MATRDEGGWCKEPGEKIPVVDGGCSVNAYGIGGTVSCLYICKTVEDTLKLQAAIENLVKKEGQKPC